MRTYGIVCMAASALTLFVGYAPLWYGAASPGAGASASPTQVVGGIATGVGFLGAGVIMRDGFTIRGLTTAASIWAVAAVGVLLGVGFYPTALVLAVLCMFSLSAMRRLESKLPGRSTLDVTITFVPGHAPKLEDVEERARARGARVVRESLTVSFSEGRLVWRFAVVALDRARAVTPAALADELVASQMMTSFNIVPVRI
jgi:putative Mg2+ transporter-C (MgtC) family protein